MRLILVAGLSLAVATSGSARPAAGMKQSGPISARVCPTPAVNQKPGEPAKMRKLHELPRAETYAAVYYLDGCPRRLVEAQGKRAR